jgi:hypothetical protein
MLSGPDARPKTCSVVENCLGFEVGKPLLYLGSNSFVNIVGVRHFSIEISHCCLPLVSEAKLLLFLHLIGLKLGLWLLVDINSLLFRAGLIVLFKSLLHLFSCLVFVDVRSEVF